jgi:hypothetical protein
MNMRRQASKVGARDGDLDLNLGFRGLVGNWEDHSFFAEALLRSGVRV